LKIIEPSFEILDKFDGIEILKKIEFIGRVAYQSYGQVSKDSYKSFIQNIINRGHLSVIEHFNISVKIICDRGISHELVRHRLASYTMESQRYCNYNKKEFNFEIEVIKPLLNEKSSSYELWKSVCINAENSYMKMLDNGISPQIARSVLPNSAATTIVITANLREWRHIFQLRTSKNAHPQMREVMVPLLEEMKKRLPIIFDGIIGEE